MIINYYTSLSTIQTLKQATSCLGSTGIALAGLGGVSKGSYEIYKIAKETLKDPERKISRPALIKAVMQTGVGLVLVTLALWTLSKSFPRKTPSPVNDPTNNPASNGAENTPVSHLIIDTEVYKAGNLTSGEEASPVELPVISAEGPIDNTAEKDGSTSESSLTERFWTLLNPGELPL